MNASRVIPALVAGLVLAGIFLIVRFVRARDDRPGSAATAAVAAVTPAKPVRAPAAETKPAATPAETADEAARNAAELNAMFAVTPRPNPARAAAAKNAQGERGKQVYLGLCYACHQPDGRGLPGAFPMLARSDFMLADRARAIRIVLQGLTGPVTVNGQTINSVMPAQATTLTDRQIADVLTYVFNAWGNPGGAFTTDEVGAVRHAIR